jgi:hypothetical protein
MPAAESVTDQRLWFLHNLAHIRLDAEESAGSLDIVELAGTRGEMPPLHAHHREDECFVVLEGEMALFLPGSASSTPARRHSRRGVCHTPTESSPPGPVGLDSPPFGVRLVRGRRGRSGRRR